MLTIIIQFMKVSILAGVPFGFFMAAPVFALALLVVELEVALFLGLAIWIGAGVLFGCASAASFAVFNLVMKSRAPKLEGETIVFQGVANHFAGWEGRGGWLTMTETHLAFRSHGLNFQNHPVEIPIESIVHAAPSLSLGVIPNGLQVSLNDGTDHFFVVEQRKVWLKKIEERIAAAGTGTRPESMES